METEFIIVTPAKGYTIMDPNTFLKISAEGTRVRKSAYWDRLLKEGAIKVESEKKPEPTPPDPKPPEDQPKAKKPSIDEAKK